MLEKSPEFTVGTGKVVGVAAGAEKVAGVAAGAEKVVRISIVTGKINKKLVS